METCLFVFESILVSFKYIEKKGWGLMGYLLCCQFEQAVEQTFELLVWYAAHNHGVAAITFHHVSNYGTTHIEYNRRWNALQLTVAANIQSG